MVCISRTLQAVPTINVALTCSTLHEKGHYGDGAHEKDLDVG